jgi:predicted nuclease of predicted toxin-antitoxin system
VSKTPTVYLNENIAIRVAQLLQARGVQTFHTLEVGNQGITDEAQLEYATRQQYILATHNRRDFRRLHRRWIDGGRAHQGIIVIGFSTPERITERIALFLEKEYPQLEVPFCKSPPPLESPQ